MNAIPGLQEHIQSFPGRTTKFPIFSLIYGILGGILILIPFLYLKGFLWAGFFSTLMVLMVSIVAVPILKRVRQRKADRGHVEMGENLIYEISPKQGPSTKNLVILAHYDSISRRYPIVFTSIYGVLAYAGGYVFVLHNLIYAIPRLLGCSGWGQSTQMLWGIVIGVFLIIGSFDHATNESPGVTDNASGVAYLYHLGSILSKSPLNTTRVVLVATDAEELGNLGGIAYMKQFAPDLPKDNSYFLIVDTIGIKNQDRIVSGSRFPKRNYSPFLETVVRNILKNSRYSAQLYRFPPFLAVMSDHNPVMDAHYQFLLFGGISLNLHSKKDNIAAIDHEEYFQVVEILDRLIDNIDRKKIST
jgi:hypothetical protein